MLPTYSGDSLRHRSIGAAISEKLKGWFRLIVSDSHSRNLAAFLLLNFSFAFVELLYGVWTNSLGLICDSFHMFFDCTGLIAGLAASLITKWRPNDKFSYGLPMDCVLYILRFSYVRAEVLAGFVNGLFLIFIAFFIFSEAIERLIEPPEIHHEKLLVVAVLGFIVNMIGIFVFHDAAHGHSHGGGGHSHGGSTGPRHYDAFENGNLVSLYAGANDASSPFTVSPNGGPPNYGYANNNHSHDDHHGHSHSGGGSHGHSHGTVHRNADPVRASDNQIMRGVFLHVLADTLGSVGVIISAIVIRMFGWMIADPICSICISALIMLSVISLIKESASVLMMRTPRDLDHVLPNCYQKVMSIEGVYSIQEPHFWTLCSDVYVGTVKLEISPKADPRYVTQTAHSIFAQAGVRQIYIQLDFAAV